MNQLFSSGLEVANLVVSSGLLKISWAKIKDCYGGLNLSEQQSLGLSLRWQTFQEANVNIIAFITYPTCTKFHLQHAELVSSSALKETSLFEFFCNNGMETSFDFSIHKATITLFAAYINELLQLKNQCGESSSPLIVTGHALGGSVASLFTIWLLESLNNSNTKRPLCLTFGSPLLGDEGFQQAISEHPTWNSCFLHVATSKDSVPRLFTAPHYLHNMGLTLQPNYHKPFGTFLLCSETGCTWSDNPEAISELMVAMELEGAGNEEQLIVDYGRIVVQLEYMIICKEISQVSSIPESFQAGIVLQLESTGLQKAQNQQQQDNDFNNLIRKLEEFEVTCILRRRKVIDPAKKLNDIKIKMALLEWYKKAAKAQEIGYYDCYKKQVSRWDKDIIKYKKFLTNYWKDFVAQTEGNPQKEQVYLQERWVFAGTAYRRMIEPLDIGDYYRSGKKNYMTNGRSHHYIKLEQWSEEKLNDLTINTKKQNVDDILTNDSCFWAHVEEALIWCKSLENAPEAEGDTLRQKLIKFEMYVMEQIKKYAVSSEIFLKNSSFMLWWKEYEKIIEPSYNSELTDFMKNCKYHRYANG